MSKFGWNSCVAAIVFVIGFSAHAEPIIIGTLAELTGPFTRYGEDCRKGYEVAEKLNSGSIRVLYGDNQNDPKVGISEFRRYVDAEHASLVITTRSSVAMALNPLSAQQHIPLIGIAGHPRFMLGNPYAIRVFPSSGDEAQILAETVKRNNETRIAIVSIEDEYFLGLRDAFKEKVGKDRIVFVETISPAEQDFMALLPRIKQSSPTALFINVGPMQMSPFIRRVRESGLRIPIYANFLVGTSDIQKSLGESGEGIRFCELDFDKPQFLKALGAQTGTTETSPIGYACYVGLTYALQLLKTAGSGSGVTAPMIAATSEVSVLDERIKIVNREAKFLIVPKIIRGGKVIKDRSMP